ncbi:NAD(P)H-quinone oxidoreductase subunit F [Synechococcus sp. PCC 6312]|uniref:NAD(P)H-quinone oxidoreductase subunit F n=1 Tax=Synechococcus sp. (strain ATCC 27167 / PCC 6312) TaxID=195253 RepID=UPI00029EF683|nr:NAD(P)H-quinone oxidoreductase subunit F [Synechococcus sp. PCC 6312]AFY60911.1 NAD(P)H dehydrogenase, subunit NdhF3 family [Synechococcus sp. PCC 6312]
MADILVATSWLVPCYGLLGALATLPWATGWIKRTGPRPAAYLNFSLTFIAFVHGLLVFRILEATGPTELIWHWLSAPGLDIAFPLSITPLSVGAMELVTGLSLLAQLFALGYMEKDWGLGRFFALMGFFEAALSGLALSNSLLLSYMLLELLTLSTYLLVGFWYAQPLVVTAARDAFLTKRVGDILLLMGVVALATQAGSLDFPVLYDWAENANLSPGLGFLLGLALIAGPTGKCAQFPLHLWLDEAMEGPNPASIMRNSVVVGAGAYVLIKLQPILVHCYGSDVILITLGAVTAIGASLVAMAQIDVKRALSHSTSAYLGLVFVAVGCQWINVAYLVLLTHGIAKALLFMTMGCVINTTNCQDLTELGGLGKRMPATVTGFVVGSAALVGVLPLGGFWAGYRVITRVGFENPGLVAVMLIVNALTALNLMRMMRLVFLGQAQPKTRRAPEVPWPMAVPLVSLTILCVLVPVILARFQLLPLAADLDWTAVVLLTGSGIIGMAAGGLVNLNRTWSRPLQGQLRFLQDLFAYDFYVDRLYRVTVVAGVQILSQLSTWLDRYVVDNVVNLTGRAALAGGEFLKYGTGGQSQAYLILIFSALLVAGLFLVKPLGMTFGWGG